MTPRPLEERLAMAVELREEGYNCAQSVLMVFDDYTGLDTATACRVASGLGAGIGGCKELCGVPNAMAIVQGFALPAKATAKPLAMKRAADLLKRFSIFTGGRLRCADLKGKPDSIPCNDLIMQGIRLLHDFIEEERNAI